MIVWSSSPWSARLVPPVVVSDYTQVTRAALEVIHETLPVDAETRRVILEVLATVGFTNPTTIVTAPRVTAEVVGLAKEFIGRYGVATRTTLEAITSFALAHRGFKVPDLFVDAFSVALAVDLDLTGPGYLGLIDDRSYGYSLSWDSASPTSITETWRSANTTVTSTFPAPAGRLVRSFVLPIGGGEVLLTDLGTQRPVGKDKLGTLLEIMVWNRGLDNPERGYVEAYLRCKWIPSSCEYGNPLTPGQQQVILDGLVESGNSGTNPGYGELVDDMRDSPAVLEFLGCMSVDMPPDPADPDRPFRLFTDLNCSLPGCPYWEPQDPTHPFWVAAGSPDNIYNLEQACQTLAAAADSGPDYAYSYSRSQLINEIGSSCWINQTYLPSNVTFEIHFPFRGLTPVPAPSPYSFLTMDELVALVDYCIMFDLGGQAIIDSEGYLGEIPEGMEPTPPVDP